MNSNEESHRFNFGRGKRVNITFSPTSSIDDSLKLQEDERVPVMDGLVLIVKRLQRSVVESGVVETSIVAY